MKKYIGIIALLLMAVNAYSQEQKEIARFYVTKAVYNGTDMTKGAISSGLFTVFYSVGKELYMANYSEAEDTQSWGPIWGLEVKESPETSTQYETAAFYFYWNYQNSYDSETGTCKVQFVKTYKPQGVVSTLKLVTETLDVIEYTGYMEGSIDFSGFN